MKWVLLREILKIVCVVGVGVYCALTLDAKKQEEIANVKAECAVKGS